MDNTASREEFFHPFQKRPDLFILSGPSGVGKDAVLHKLKETSLQLKYVVTMTTRPRRERERDNIDYIFVSKEYFQDLVENAVRHFPFGSARHRDRLAGQQTDCVLLVRE